MTKLTNDHVEKKTTKKCFKSFDPYHLLIVFCLNLGKNKKIKFETFLSFV